MNDMNEIVSKKIDDLRLEIEEQTTLLRQSIEEFKERVKSSDTYDIVTLLPGLIGEIEWENRRIKALEEQKKMLVLMVKEAQR